MTVTAVSTSTLQEGLAHTPAPIATLLEIVFPGDTNHHGTLFGGAGLAYMDRIAFIAASRHGRVPFVTASCENVGFHKPAHVGEIVSFDASIREVRRRSLTVEVKMAAQTILGGERHVCTAGVFHMVALPAEGKAAGWSLPPLTEEAAPARPDELRMADIVFADQVNGNGALFGGHALAFMTKAAFISASRLSGRLTVLAATRQIEFHHPVALGAIVEAVARIASVGRSSIHVEVDLWSEGLLTGKRQLAAKGQFVMVAVDASHRPVAARQKPSAPES
ncbi:acyl-CoA thioesterase [Pannonibacter indicus]|uniref:Acyl-CoA hydrolase n=1 Tax=Pannonibacter indicus TaxID=466044 RepID=A0A0K6I442_9HYPH|nr:hotdog domain-containing protein [Pannonibacter indicus]CUA97900.1 Acyl-CoA hydrolase [Pannonibacter indicus]